MKKVSINNFKSIYLCISIIFFYSCRNTRAQNIDNLGIPTEKIDTHKVYEHEPHVYPRRPKLNDSINPPQFIGGIESFKDTVQSVLIKIYRQKNIKEYSRMHFTINVNKFGIASGLKIKHLTKNVENEFIKIYPTMLKNIKEWKPAMNRNNNQPVKYQIHIEIESYDGKKIDLLLFNTDFEDIYRGNF